MPLASWASERQNYQTSEPALDYNAGFTGTLAAQLELVGGLGVRAGRGLAGWRGRLGGLGMGGAGLAVPRGIHALLHLSLPGPVPHRRHPGCGSGARRLASSSPGEARCPLMATTSRTGCWSRTASGRTPPWARGTGTQVNIWSHLPAAAAVLLVAPRLRGRCRRPALALGYWPSRHAPTHAAVGTMVLGLVFFGAPLMLFFCWLLARRAEAREQPLLRSAFRLAAARGDMAALDLLWRHSGPEKLGGADAALPDGFTALHAGEPVRAAAECWRWCCGGGFTGRCMERARRGCDGPAGWGICSPLAGLNWSTAFRVPCAVQLQRRDRCRRCCGCASVAPTWQRSRTTPGAARRSTTPPLQVGRVAG